MKIVQFKDVHIGDFFRYGDKGFKEGLFRKIHLTPKGGNAVELSKDGMDEKGEVGFFNSDKVKLLKLYQDKI